MRRHDDDFLTLRADYEVPITLDEYDSMTQKRIARMIDIQATRLKERNALIEAQKRNAEKAALRNKIQTR
jgi:hypothetical protein